MSISSVVSPRAEAVSVLSRLVRLCRDGEGRFRHAADAAAVDALRELLFRHARERARFAHELEIEAHVLGGLDAAPASSTSGRRPRADTSTPRGDLHRVLACREGEGALMAEYERAVRAPLPVELERLLRGHHAAIKEACERLEQIARALA